MRYYGLLLAQKLSRREIEALIQRKLQWLLANADPVRVYLIGSARSRSMDATSDIDLVVIFATRESLEASKPRLFASRPKDDWPHDLLLFDEETFAASAEKGGGVCWVALREGELLHEKPGLNP